jgi:hypothetical protein
MYVSFSDSLIPHHLLLESFLNCLLSEGGGGRR